MQNVSQIMPIGERCWLFAVDFQSQSQIHSHDNAIRVRTVPNSLVLDAVKMLEVISGQMSKMQGKSLFSLLVLNTMDISDDDLRPIPQLAVDVCCELKQK